VGGRRCLSGQVDRMLSSVSDPSDVVVKGDDQDVVEATFWRRSASPCPSKARCEPMITNDIKCLVILQHLLGFFLGRNVIIRGYGFGFDVFRFGRVSDHGRGRFRLMFDPGLTLHVLGDTKQGE